MWNSGIHRNSFNITKYDNSHPLALQKIKILQRTQIIGTLTSEDVRLNKNYLRDTLEINWDKIKLSFNSNEVETV